MTTFTEKYDKRVAGGAYVCVGLDPDIEQIPTVIGGSTIEDRVYHFVCTIVDVTREFAACYKLQSSYYEGLLEDEASRLSAVSSTTSGVSQAIYR